MNLFGASLIVVAGFYIGFLKASEIRRRVAALRGVCTMTELIRNEISSRRTPMDELFSMLQKSGPKTTESFAASVCDRLKSLDESSFSELWNESVSENLSCLPQRCTTALCELGASLGRYEGSKAKSKRKNVHRTLRRAEPYRSARLGLITEEKWRLN